MLRNSLISTIFYVFTAFLFIFSFPQITNAAEIITNSEVYLDVNNTYTENLYIGAGLAEIDSQIKADLTVLGGENFIKSIVDSDIFVGGGTTEFSGEVFGDLRVISGEVIISGTVHGDLLIIGGDVQITDQSNILGDILIIGADVNISGDAIAKTKIVSASTFINSYVSGVTEITTQNLILGSNAIINGEFFYYSPNKLIEKDGSVIVGNITFNQINSIQNTSIIKKALVSFLSFWFVLRFITTLLIAFILVYIFKVFATETTNFALKSLWKSLFAGILTIILLPISVVILFVSLIGMPIALIIILGLLLFMIISPAIAGIYVGAWIREFIIHIKNKEKVSDWEYKIDFHTATLGVILLTVLQFVPIIGGLIRSIITIVALGAIARFIYKAIVK
jgi:hypothetical protein